jgi:hypothetical protein
MENNLVSTILVFKRNLVDLFSQCSQQQQSESWGTLAVILSQMGYYIYHDKFTLEKPENSFGHELIESSFTNHDLDLFEKYFQTVKTKTFIDSMILVSNNQQAFEEKLRLNYFNGVFNKEDEKSIENYINHKKYNKLAKEETKLHDGRIIINFYNIESKFGYYKTNIFEHTFKDCHYQFYEKYNSGETYSSMEVFREACNLKYDEYRHESKLDYEAEIKLFKDNLIEKFEYGKSILQFF